MLIIFIYVYFYGLISKIFNPLGNYDNEQAIYDFEENIS